MPIISPYRHAPRLSAPRGPTTINWDSPIAHGLLHMWLFGARGDTFVWPQGDAPTLTTLTQGWLPTPNGAVKPDFEVTGANPSNSDELQYDATVFENAIGDKLTIAIEGLFQRRNSTSTPAMFAYAHPSNTQYDLIFASTHTSNDQMHFFLDTGGVTTAYGPTTGLSSNEVAQGFTVARYDGANIDVYWREGPPGAVGAWGSQVATTGNVNTTNNFVLRMGSWVGGGSNTSQFRPDYVGLWTRALSNEEVELLNRSPWELHLEHRGRTWFLPSAAIAPAHYHQRHHNLAG